MEGIVKDRVADFGSHVVQLWIGGDSGILDEPLKFEVAWPHYDDNSRIDLDKAEAAFLNLEHYPRTAVTPERSSSPSKSSNARTLIDKSQIQWRYFLQDG